MNLKMVISKSSVSRLLLDVEFTTSTNGRKVKSTSMVRHSMVLHSMTSKGVPNMGEHLVRYNGNMAMCGLRREQGLEQLLGQAMKENVSLLVFQPLSAVFKWTESESIIFLKSLERSMNVQYSPQHPFLRPLL